MAHEPSVEYPRAQDAQPPESTYRLLFLDSAEHVELLKLTCKRYGYVVVGAESIPEAWAFLNGKDHVDVIVCGAHLERRSGRPVTPARRSPTTGSGRSTADAGRRREPSGGTRIPTRSRAAMALGADAYAIMPVFDPDALIEQIRQIQPETPNLMTASPSERLRSG